MEEEAPISLNVHVTKNSEYKPNKRMHGSLPSKVLHPFLAALPVVSQFFLFL